MPYDADVSIDSITFTATAADMTVDLTYVIDSTLLQGTSAVVFEDLIHDGVTINTHHDIEDDDQTVYYPAIDTVLTDSETGIHEVVAGTTFTPVDTISYENLVVGEEYRLVSVLMVKETGEVYSQMAEQTSFDEENGTAKSALYLKEWRVETTFTATEADGTITVEFEDIDTTDIEGMTLVAYEYLYTTNSDDEWTEITDHEDINDEDQSIHVPEIDTTLKSITGSKMANAETEITLVDTVTYKNLIAGNTYTVTGTLMDKETGEPMLDDNGNEITTEAEFTAEDTDGSVDITFTFSGVSLAGKSVVAFETVYYEDIEVAVHTDIKDDDQTVDFPKVTTDAKDSNGSDYVTSAAQGSVIDVVTYENVIVGEEYTVKGTLMDKTTGEAILDMNGDPVTAEAAFVAEESSGTVELTFKVHSNSFYGAAVAFERLYDVNGVLIETHEDIDDENQTVYFPEIKTSLANVNGDKALISGGTAKLVDTVTYTNLEVGTTYRLVGTLMDKSTGKAAVDADSNEITAETVFTVETTNGSVEVVFEFDSEGLEGTYIAFEELYKVCEDYEVIYAEHKDLGDADQTVTIKMPEITEEPDTGDNTNLMFWSFLAAAALAAAGLSLYSFRKQNLKDK